MTYEPDAKMRAWCNANGWDADLHAELFNDYLANKTGKPYRDLDAAFRNCVRCDWGGVRRQALINKKFEPPKLVKSWRETREGVANKASEYEVDITGMTRLEALYAIDCAITLRNTR